jgi:pimeloyl-ACP methyl ester carboxylesterase
LPKAELGGRAPHVERFYQSPDRATSKPCSAGDQPRSVHARWAVVAIADHSARGVPERSGFPKCSSTFTTTGFRGGLNWYRNFDRNWELTSYLKDAKVTQPALMITAELDPVLRPEMAAGMPAWVPNLRRAHMITDSGHWTQQEKPDG